MSGLLGLVATPGRGAELRPLVRALSTVCEVRSLSRCDRRPDAVLGTDAEAAARAPEGVPTACWVAADAPAPGFGMIAVGPGAGAGGVVVPAHGLPIGDVHPIAGLVRQRWRVRLGLPATWTVDIDAVDEPDRETASALCDAAVVTTAPELARALALGTPSVVVSSVAALLACVDGLHVVTCGDSTSAPERLAVARALGADRARAAAMATAGRALAEATLDVSAPARSLAHRLGLVAGPAGGSLDRLGRRLDELGAPTGSAVRARVAAATVHLTGVPA